MPLEIRGAHFLIRSAQLVRETRLEQALLLAVLQVTGRHKLAPGNYCIIPSTFAPGEQGDYLLRVYTEQPIRSQYVHISHRLN